jgi:hypothetical protein
MQVSLCCRTYGGFLRYWRRYRATASAHARPNMLKSVEVLLDNRVCIPNPCA